MFPKQNRLSGSEIRSVLRSKNRVSSRELQLVFQKNNLSVSRFAVIVGSNIDKRATARNRIKRLIRESIRHLTSKIAPGWDIIILVKMNIAKLPQSQVEKLILTSLENFRML